MPVVINDFEIVVEPPPQEKPGPGATQQETVLSPLDIEVVLRHELERQKRVRAH
jgi:hypothetical protein